MLENEGITHVINLISHKINEQDIVQKVCSFQDKSNQNSQKQANETSLLQQSPECKPCSCDDRIDGDDHHELKSNIKCNSNDKLKSKVTIKHLCLSMRDQVDCDITFYSYATIEFIEEALKETNNQAKILIHCYKVGFLL